MSWPSTGVSVDGHLISLLPSHIDLGTQEVFKLGCGRVTGHKEKVRGDVEKTGEESIGLKGFEIRKFSIGTTRLREEHPASGHSAKLWMTPLGFCHLTRGPWGSEPWSGLGVAFNLVSWQDLAPDFHGSGKG